MYLSNLFLASAAPAQVEMETSSFQALMHSNFLNIVLVFIFIVWLIRKFKVFSVIGKKQEEIKQSIKNSEEAKIRAELELDSIEKKTRKSNEEVQKIIDSAEETAGTLSEQIIKDTHNEIKNLEDKNQKIFKGETQAAANKLSSNVSHAAFDLAEEHIKQSLDERLHRKFISEFIDSLENVKV